MKLPTMSRGIVISGLIILFVLIAIVRGIWIYEGTITAKDEVIQLATAQRVRSEDREKIQRELTEEIRQDSLRRDLLAREAISNIRTELGSLQSNIRGLERSNRQLQATLQVQPEIVEAASSDEVALSIPPKILELYPQYSDSSINYFSDIDLFEINRPGANAFLLSLNEVDILRANVENLGGQIVLHKSAEERLDAIIEEQNNRVSAWTDRAESAEDLNKARRDVILTLTNEKDAWEDKSKVQGRQLFLYKWGTRIGLTAVAVVGVLVAK